MKTRKSIDTEQLQRLKEEVERRLPFPIKSPDDYSRLSDLLKDEGCGTVSATTLKRIWGYISDVGSDYRPNAYTITALCRLIGFRDIEEFTASDFPVQSREYNGTFVESRSLPKDSIVELRWQPNRVCTLQYLGNTLFKVISVENSTTLREGDEVECGCFTQHAPVYFPRVFREGSHPMTAIAGAASGITFSITEPDPEAPSDAP
ncbi:MAG: hypothetical protein K2L17_03405 [Muribaculaceae bacterium]|nr:hypothetical protein [Muribaculaceae bacterium]